jgi:hypothetical protein
MRNALEESRTTNQVSEPIRPGGGRSQAGFLVMKTDEWERDRDTTTRILDRILRSVSSVSHVVFMENANRTAAIAVGCKAIGS